MPKLIAFLSLCALLVFAAGFVIWLRFLAPSGPWGRGLDTPALVRQMQQMKELVSVRYVIQKVVGMREPKTPFGQESILLMVQAKVIAGVDLARMSPADVQVKDRQHVILRLPPPHLLDVYLDEKETKVWDRHITWWTPWVAADPDLERKARMAAIEEVRKAALEGGILQDAEKSAETAIRDFLKALGIEVEFRPGAQSSRVPERPPHDLRARFSNLPRVASSDGRIREKARKALNDSWYGCARCVDRLDEFNQLGPIGRGGQSIDAARSGASMLDVVHHFIERERRSIVEEGLGKCEQREQRRGNESVGPKRRRAVLANLVERRGIEGAHVPQFANQLPPPQS